eukprot:3435352-Rhodomonas_salina.2
MFEQVPEDEIQTQMASVPCTGGCAKQSSQRPADAEQAVFASQQVGLDTPPSFPLSSSCTRRRKSLVTQRVHTHTHPRSFPSA